MNEQPTPACTVMLLRPAEQAFEVFMLRRHQRSGFMPHMWVFPGGRVEPSDGELADHRILGSLDALNGFGFERARMRAMAVGGVRETFEECGVWLGEGAPPEHTRLGLQSGEHSFAELLERHDARVAVGGLRPWARWVTPYGKGRRFDAVFLVAEAGDERARHDEVETVESGWHTPEQMLAGGFEAFPLGPPTWCVIRQLHRYQTVQEVLSASTTQDLRPVQPVRAVRDGRLSLLLPGDDGHPESRRLGLPTRVDLGDRSWVAAE
jgi:8-oxo-dGTP pyrophosphatase MutT (NUDIX family)